MRLTKSKIELMAKKNGYDLSRRWFDFAFENKEAKTTHTAIFMWIVELNNRLGWKEEFGLPTGETMEGLSIGNKNTYSDAIKDLVKWKFIEIVRDAKNQYESRIIKICRDESEPALIRPLDLALLQHRRQHSTGTDTGTVPIDKQINNETIKPLNQETLIPGSELPGGSEKAIPSDTGSKPKRKVPPKEKGETKPETITQRFLEAYDIFLNERTGSGEKFSVPGRAGLKKIIDHLRAQVKKKNPDEDDIFIENQTVHVWNVILQYFDKWDKFHQGQLKLEQINSNLVNIMASIKSQKQNGKHIDPEQLAAEAMQFYDNQRN